MHPCPHPNNRLVMTAPRPRLPHRLLSMDDDNESSLSSSIDGAADPEEIIRKNLFAPPAVVQNDIIMPSYNRHPQHKPHQQQIYQRGKLKSIVNTPPRQHGTCSKIKRTGNDQYCGLSAQITREISYRTPHKTPANTPAGKKRSVVLMTPVSRDLFRAKSSMTSSSLVHMNDGKMMQIEMSRTASMSSDGNSDVSSSLEDHDRSDASSNPATKKRGLVNNSTPNNKAQPKKKTRMRKTPFPSLSARKRQKKCLTPPRMNFGSHKKPSSRTSSAAAYTLSTSYDGVNDYRLTSTEHDPSPFQVELPTKREIIVSAKICSLMDGYTAIHRDFNFAMLSGVARSTLQREYERSTPDKPMIAGSCHRDVVAKLLQCANDLVVEGFFREYTEEGKDRESERIEACILSSESLRQIIVCFRGSTANQAKPLSKSINLFERKQGSCILHEEQRVPILDTFRSAYFGTPLEKTVFALLSNLATRKPFFDVVMTGHSFGAAMATIASLRYASSNSQMRVSCNVFSSPRIGCEQWRQMVHSTANLRIYRVENASDPYVLLPSGNEWVQCGHAIQIGDGAEFKARRFDRESHNNNNLLGFVQAKVIPKNHHDIQSHVEKLTQSGDKWFGNFCEMKGKGVSGANNEKSPRMLT